MLLLAWLSENMTQVSAADFVSINKLMMCFSSCSCGEEWFHICSLHPLCQRPVKMK